MIDSLTEIQNRVSDIQAKIASLSPSADVALPLRGASRQPLGTFAQALAGRLRSAGDAGVPPASLGRLPAANIGRRPLGDWMPGATAPLTPAAGQTVPNSSGAGNDYQPLVDRYAARNGLSPSLVGAVIQTESGGNPHAVSPAGAMGLMQLMPDDVQTAGITDPFDPEQNIAAGTKQLADLLARYSGNLDLALAGFNAGAGAVRKYGGVPPFRETRSYIQKVRSAMGNNGP
jgi:soluble lytic murein transglycosylase-like protein